MARKIDVFVVEAENRDFGKTFILTEMPASKAEKFAARAFLVLARTKFPVPPDLQSLGFVGLFLLGYQAFGFASFAEVEPLLDEMFSCVQLRTSTGIDRPLVEADIEEVTTRLEIRRRLVELHVGFTFAEAASKLMPATTSAPRRRKRSTSPA